MTDLTDERLAEIEANARKATPGPWHRIADPCHYHTLSTVEAGGVNVRGGMEAPTMVVQVGGTARVEAQESNAAHTANMDPATTLGLIARLRAAESRAEAAEKDARMYQWLLANCSYGITKHQVAVLSFPPGFVAPDHIGLLSDAIAALAASEKGEE